MKALKSNLAPILVLLLIICGCNDGGLDGRKIGEVKANTTTFCVGRHLVDVPTPFAPATVTTGIFKTAAFGTRDPSFEVTVRSGVERAQFEAEVGRRREELKEKGDDTTDALRFEKTLSEEGTLFRVQQIDDAYVSEVVFLRGTSLVIASLNSYRNTFLVAEERLLNFAAAVEANAPQNPSSKGFCLGTVRITGPFEAESGSFVFRDGKGDDLGIEMNTNRGGGEPLLSRMSGPASLLSKFNIGHTVLRARERNVAGMHAQEWLGWANLGGRGDEKTFQFALETLPSRPSKDTPYITLSFNTARTLEDGTRTKTLMSDEEAMQFWDSVVQSIRPAKS